MTEENKSYLNMSDEDFLKEMESSDSTSTNQGELDNEDRNLHEQTSSLSGSSGQEQSDDAEGDDGSVTGEHSDSRTGSPFLMIGRIIGSARARTRDENATYRM